MRQSPDTSRYGIKIGQDGEPALGENQNLIAIVRRKKNGHRIAIVDRAIREGYSVIRGLHFVEDDQPRRDNHREVPENAPPEVCPNVNQYNRGLYLIEWYKPQFHTDINH